MQLKISILIFLSYHGFSLSQSYFPPAHEPWLTKSPEEFGLKINALNKAIEFANSNEFSGERDLRVAILNGFAQEPYHQILGPTKKRGGPAGIILKNGYQIASWGDTRRVDMTFSVTKSYLSTIAGLALDRGLIKTDDVTVNSIWDTTFDGAHNEQITWKHLLTQSSDWSGTLWGSHDWADRPPEKGSIDDWKNRNYYTPGTHFEYNDVRVNVLAYSLLQVWRKPLPQILKEKIMDPIGASNTWRWYGYNNSWVELDGNYMQSVSGGGHSGGGIFINTEDHARFGLLFLNEGNWNGTQLLSKSWIKKATSPSTAQNNYGYMWWLNKKGTPRYWKGIPENVYYAAGFGGNFIVIIPNESMVIVARWLEPSQIGGFVRQVLKSIP